MKYWDITKIHKTEDGTVISIKVNDKMYNETTVSFKWDGCIDLNREGEYIHICDINNMIEQLQEIKKIAEDHFSKENYNEYWK